MAAGVEGFPAQKSAVVVVVVVEEVEPLLPPPLPQPRSLSARVDPLGGASSTTEAGTFLIWLKFSGLGP